MRLGNVSVPSAPLESIAASRPLLGVATCERCSMPAPAVNASECVPLPNPRAKQVGGERSPEHLAEQRHVARREKKFPLDFPNSCAPSTEMIGRPSPRYRYKKSPTTPVLFVGNPIDAVNA